MSAPTNVLALLDDHLDPGEALLWSGRPQKRWFRWPSDIGPVVFGLIMVAFGIGFLVDALVVTEAERHEEMGAQVGPGVAFALVWLAVSLVMAGVRPYQRRWMAQRCAFGLTPSRAMVVYEGRWLHRSREAFLDESELDVRRRRDGSGTLTFRAVHGNRSNGGNDPFIAMLTQNGLVMFAELAEVDPVVQQVRHLRMTRRDRTLGATPPDPR